jgi:hypothetical protein
LKHTLPTPSEGAVHFSRRWVKVRFFFLVSEVAARYLRERERSERKVE